MEGLRLLGAILTGGGLMGAGLWAVKRLRIRASLLTSAIEMLTGIRAEIVFALTPLPSALKRLSCNGPRLIKPILTAACREWEQDPRMPFRAVWETVVEALASAGLNPDDLEPLSSLGTVLGRFDGDTQVQALDMAVERLEEKRISAYQVLRDKSKVYGALGAAAGLGMVILLW